MAYFTRSRMIMMGLDMYETNQRFNQGPTDNKQADLTCLIECQQKALVLGEYLETFGMDYSDIVSEIEKYCNFIYDMAENLNDTDQIIKLKFQVDYQVALLVQKFQDRIIEISSIDIFDFSNVAETKKEKVLIEKEINRLIDNCIKADGKMDESEEFTREILVGQY